MLKPIQLSLTNEAFQGLHLAIDKTRRNSKTVSVDKDTLTKLLMDHGRVLAALGPSNYIEEPSTS